jgi:hypothetical protein
MDPNIKGCRRMESNAESARHTSGRSATPPPPRARQTFAGRAVLIAIAAALLALMWPDYAGYDRSNSFRASGQH